MHQTTLRFGPDLWSALEAESERMGVSVAQFVRDAAISRLAFSQGVVQGRIGGAHVDLLAPGDGRLADRVAMQLSSTEAVRAQGRLARDRARRLREDADRVRAKARAPV
jgi:hypothetical protein